MGMEMEREQLRKVSEVLSKQSNPEPFESFLSPFCAQVGISKKLLRAEKIYEE